MFVLSYFVVLIAITSAIVADGTTLRPQVGQNTLGAVIFFCYILAALYLTGHLIFNIIRLFSYNNKVSDNAGKHADNSIESSSKKGAVLKRKQEDRNGERTSRRGWAIWFSGLAMASFAVLSWNMLNFLISSYIEWARRHAVPVSLRLTDVYEIEQFLSSIWSWATDSNLFRTFAEDLLADAQTWKHAQLALLYSYAWNIWMSMLGFKLNIPHLWVYFALDQILPVSFTQNLFCTALMLSKTPSETSRLPNNATLTKPATTFAYVVALFFMPTTIDTSWFFPTLFVLRILLFTPFVVDQFADNSRGTRWYSKKHDARRSNHWSLLILAVYGLCMLTNVHQFQFKVYDIARFNYAGATLRNDLIVGMVSSASYIIASR